MASSPAFEAALALSRFGLGSGRGGVEPVAGHTLDVLRREIDAGAPDLPGHDLPETPDLINLQEDYRAAKKALRERRLAAKALATGTDTAGTDAAKIDAESTPPARGDLPLSPATPAYFNELAVRSRAWLKPKIGFSERLVMFWANHFAISLEKGKFVEIAAGAFEREAIRPHVFGRFKDMVLAVETHPAMLQYLDNQKSIGPNSTAGQTSERGLNENLAREIMELHILGVASGYSQADVTAFARALTGWTVSRTDKLRASGPDARRGDFDFVRQRHEPGEQVVLGQAYPDDGFFQAADIMIDLASRPAAARFIAHKLARHFVSDTPPPTLVDRLADVFLRTDGDLAALSHTLIDSPEAWAPQTPKLRTPQEHVIAMLRATGVKLPPRKLDTLLTAMGQPMWAPPGPNGFSDLFAVWATPTGLHARIEAANEIAGRVKDAVDPRVFAEQHLGARLSEDTRSAVGRAETMRQGLSLALLSPEFMRR